MSKFVYSRQLPETIKKEIQPLLEPLEHIIPDWCHHVNVWWSEEEDPTTAMTMTTEYPYRWSGITICPAWLSQTKQLKIENLKHELIHGFTGIVYLYAKEKIKTLLPDEKDKLLKQTILDELRERNEALTQDLTLLLEKLQPKRRKLATQKS